MHREVNTSESRNDMLIDTPRLHEILEPVIYTICQAMPVEKIFLAGMYPANPKALGVEYDLAVLFNPLDRRPLHEFESLIDNRCHDLAMISVSVFKINIVNQLLNEGNVFFSHICDPEKMLFDNGKLRLAINSFRDHTLIFSALTEEFFTLLSKARAFLSGAISFRKTQDNQLAAFMLHQTVEHTLNAFLSPFMGYRIQTHNLNKLFLYARRFRLQFYEIFPRDTDKEIKLYLTLQKAYIYGRYKNNFQVDDETLQVLISRSLTLLELTELVFGQELELLQSGKSNII